MPKLTSDQLLTRLLAATEALKSGKDSEAAFYALGKLLKENDYKNQQAAPQMLAKDFPTLKITHPEDIATEAHNVIEQLLDPLSNTHQQAYFTLDEKQHRQYRERCAYIKLGLTAYEHFSGYKFTHSTTNQLNIELINQKTNPEQKAFDKVLNAPKETEKAEEEETRVKLLLALCQEYIGHNVLTKKVKAALKDKQPNTADLTKREQKLLIAAKLKKILIAKNTDNTTKLENFTKAYEETKNNDKSKNLLKSHQDTAFTRFFSLIGSALYSPIRSLLGQKKLMGTWSNFYKPRSEQLVDAIDAVQSNFSKKPGK